MSSRQQTIIEFQQKVIEALHWSTCLNCEHWDQKGQRCLHYEQVPPPRVIVTGCKNWLATIPF